MRRARWSRQIVAFCGMLLFVNASCGPLQVPMGQRLNQSDQDAVDAGWHRAMEIQDELGRQGWLDMMVGTMAFERGVDRFQFKSEKEVDGRLVVMEVWFDRAKPDEDAFVITVFDEERKILRKERYSRDDVDEAIAVMYHHSDTHLRPEDMSNDEWRQQQADFEARRLRLKLLFPELFDEDHPADAAAPANVET